MKINLTFYVSRRIFRLPHRLEVKPYLFLNNNYNRKKVLKLKNQYTPLKRTYIRHYGDKLIRFYYKRFLTPSVKFYNLPRRIIKKRRKSPKNKYFFRRRRKKLKKYIKQLYPNIFIKLKNLFFKKTNLVLSHSKQQPIKKKRTRKKFGIIFQRKNRNLQPHYIKRYKLKFKILNYWYKQK